VARRRLKCAGLGSPQRAAATGGDLAPSVRWDELLRPGGIGDELRMALVADGRRRGSISLYRERRAPWFTRSDAAMLAGLAGPIATVARASWTADQPGSSRGEDPPGTVLDTDDGRQVTATAAAKRCLPGWIRCSVPAVR
jgi:hypothetical protein